jgi:hypothetical protein
MTTTPPKTIAIIEMIIVLSIAIAIMYFKHGYLYNDCYFNDPVLDHVRTNQTSLDYCLHGKNHQKLNQLITFLKVYCKDQACTASEFGSYVRIMYLKQRDLILINPVIEYKSDKLNVCYFGGGGEGEEKKEDTLSLETTVKYNAEGDLKLNSIKFYSIENCIFEKTLSFI